MYLKGLWGLLIRNRRALAKTLLIMKLTAIFLLVAALQVSAGGNAQTVTIAVKDASLEKVFKEIEQQTGYSFLYSKEDIQNIKSITLEVKNATLDEALGVCFRGLPFSYTIVDKVIIVKPTQAADLKSTAPSPQPLPPIDVTGRITNEQGEPLAGASLIIKRTGKGDIADAKGNFKLKNVNSDDIIEVSFTGYKPQAIKVANQVNFTVILKVAVDELDRAVVQAYGKTTQRLATGDIAKVTAEEIERQPVMNPLIALQGKVAGLDVTQTSGFASAPVKVELRGRSAINDVFTSDPLYIIDGVPLTVLELSGNSNYYRGSYGFLQSGISGPANGQSPLFSLNPMDIESIEVLKDADATAIYGSRGANGVILITTKKGKSGKTKFDLRIQEGVSKVTRYWHMMNTQQYLQMRREAYKNENLTPDLSNGAFDLLEWDTTRYTDWQRAIYGGTGKATDIQAALFGGNSQTSFRIGAGYSHNSNILTVNGADQRGSISLNLNHHSIDQRLSIALSTDYSFLKNDMNNLPQNAALLPPDAPPIYDSAGNLNYAGYGTPNSDARKAYPFANMFVPYSAKTNFLNSNMVLDYQIIKGLRLSASFGYNNSESNQQTFTTVASQDPQNNPTGNTQYGYTKTTNYIVEPQITYNFFVGKGKIDALVGSSFQQVKTDILYAAAWGYTTDDLIRVLTAAPNQGVSNASGQYNYAHLFGRLTYNWANKYILNLNVSRDGSSRFGPGKEYGNFGSIGAAWIFTEEKWFKNKLKFLSFGKIHGSYGTTGSDNVGDYGYLTRWSYPNNSGYMPYAGYTPLTPMQHANPHFHWQTNKKLEAALNLGFLKDKIQLSVAFYRNRCGDQLVALPIARLTGFPTVIDNWKALVQNSGVEFTAVAKIIEGKNFNWSMSFNTAINRNKLLAYPNIDQSAYAGSLVVGKPLNMTKLLHFTGVDPQSGSYTFEDRNKNRQIDVDYSGKTPDDRFIYDLDPKFFGGLGMNFGYKNCQLSLFFVIKKQIGNNAYIVSGSNAGNAQNQPSEIIGKEWQNPGDIASIAKFSNTPNNSFASNSDLYHTDASYIRLSNLSLTYSIPSKVIRKTGIQGCSIYFNANDLFIITKYKGLDPETQNFGGMPPSRIVVGGISFNF